jgi:GrpB-like predicted nucleotidyltransferase (UPF0157 family)
VKIFRFDAEVSRPIDGFGSDFRLGRLVQTGAGAVVQVMHLAAGGLVGRHPAVGQQLFAIVSGAGWVSGGDGRRRKLGVGYAALWDVGEEHSAGSDGGMIALCIEGDFRIAAYAVTKEIVVEDYNPEWPTWFEQIRSRIWPAVSGLAVRMDHVGSTSVPGLAAKPIIDIDIVLANEEALPLLIEALASIGYRWEGDLGVVGRQAFRPSDPRQDPRHHLYAVVENNRAHLDHVLLRDLLRADDVARERYGRLKRANAEASEGDMDYYVAAKAELVSEFLTRARAERGLPPVTYWRPEVKKL